MEKLLTTWGKNLDRNNPLPEYPRPQLRRDSFLNLNGVWDCAIYPKNKMFAGYQGEIVVPFSPETELSGVRRAVKPSDVLFYRRRFRFEKTGRRVLLHFGAVDYECRVCLNGTVLGTHKGGYTPFTFDITDTVVSGENELTLRVTDPSETGSQASGKQTFNRGNIWYTPQSGIWQTVWIEETPQDYIESIRLTPDIDAGELRVEITAAGAFSAVRAQVRENGAVKAQLTADSPAFSVPMGDDFRLWSPEDPFVYDLTLTMGEDTVESYFGMRKFSVGKDAKGVSRLMLNNKPYFHNGLLDQGYWSDGMYTAPADDALIYDIQTMKDLGFNMLRKHIKIEPLRWYYHCDRLGMLVWQDMVSGGAPVNQAVVAAIPGAGLAFGTKKVGVLNDGPRNYGLFSRADKAGRDEYYTDASQMIDLLYNCVSLALWVPFNEGWGQFDALKACRFFREKDPTRPIDHASGWHDQGGGDINSFHIYFTPFFFPKYDKNDDRVIALTEFGGFSMQTPGHVFNKEKFFGYRKYYSKEKLGQAIRTLYLKRLKPLIGQKGLSALVYTEVSDVEDETNGFLTYDRAVLKVDADMMREINAQMRLE